MAQIPIVFHFYTSTECIQSSPILLSMLPERSALRKAVLFPGIPHEIVQCGSQQVTVVRFSLPNEVSPACGVALINELWSRVAVSKDVYDYFNVYPSDHYLQMLRGAMRKRIIYNSLYIKGTLKNRSRTNGWFVPGHIKIGTKDSGTDGAIASGNYWCKFVDVKDRSASLNLLIQTVRPHNIDTNICDGHLNDYTVKIYVLHSIYFNSNGITIRTNNVVFNLCTQTEKNVYIPNKYFNSVLEVILTPPDPRTSYLTVYGDVMFRYVLKSACKNTNEDFIHSTYV